MKTPQFFKIAGKIPLIGFALSCNLLSHISCTKIIEVSSPTNAIISQDLFNSDASATSAVTGMYSAMMILTPQLLTGNLSIYAGLYSDELTSSSATSATALEFLDNSISTSNSNISGALWSNPYKILYQANSCIEGLTKSTLLSESNKNQLLGECYFIRACTYFNLINLYGPVPLVVSSDYADNMAVPRIDISIIKNVILQDLQNAIAKLRTEYPSLGRARPNVFAAKSLLARFYLYEKQWQNAERMADDVITSKKYALEKDLNGTFLANSQEAIWQVMPVLNLYNTSEGNSFVPSTSASSVPAYVISGSLLNAFESGDKRKTTWIKNKTVAGVTYNYPFKYKVRVGASTVTEYTNVIRLAELFLIRSEARANQGKISGAESASSDLDSIRLRAGLIKINAATRNDIISAIEKEKRIEYFCENGHRWFDLKRWNRASEVLKPIKAGWNESDTLFPIPEAQILLNSKLIQNKGYE